MIRQEKITSQQSIGAAVAIQQYSALSFLYANNGQHYNCDIGIAVDRSWMLD